MVRNAEPSRTVGQLMVRGLSVGLLLLIVTGGAYLGAHQEMRQASLESAAQARTHTVLAEDLRQMVEENSRVDLARWAASQQAAEVAEGEAKATVERVSYAEEAASRRSAPNRIPEAPAVPVPESCGQYSGNRAIGCALLLEAGFGLDQMPCLDSLWSKESGWNERAYNASSGAYGIPQALPGSKMASHGADWETNPATQIRWGLSYIQGRYSTPCEAYQHSQSVGWY